LLMMLREINHLRGCPHLAITNTEGLGLTINYCLDQDN